VRYPALYRIDHSGVSGMFGCDGSSVISFAYMVHPPG